jgi:hypothetical protein
MFVAGSELYDINGNQLRDERNGHIRRSTPPF